MRNIGKRVLAVAATAASLAVFSPTAVDAEEGPVVEITVTSNRITIEGTSAAESINVGTIRTGSFFVFSDDGTRFSLNGSEPTSGQIVGNRPVVRINSRGGADAIRVQEIDVRRLAIRSGGGSDTVTIEDNVTAASARLFGGSGNDSLLRSGADLSDVRVGGFETDDSDTPDPAPPTGDGIPLQRGFQTSDALVGETFVATANSFTGTSPTIGSFIATPVAFRGGLLPEDVIDLSQIDGNVNAAGNQSLRIVSAFTGTAGEVVVPTSNPAGDPQRPVRTASDGCWHDSLFRQDVCSSPADQPLAI